MKLKHLELQGFKTFATKTEFVFPTGITAIVGPNGSGKSNIADCVRWVLGEQSYSILRGKRTEDMIFAGSEQRARSGMAEARLTLDNSSGWLPVEFTEVVISRRAYRSGENEYYLNGSRVRLRDVSDVLGASGLARRTYAVIGQGLVDQALSLRPEERRTLFEEAAGIAHYQAKRDEALKKLDETQRNLERVRDILAEIGPRLRALQRQSERSQQYERLAGELRDLQRTWYGYHWGRAQQALRLARQAEAAQGKLLEERQAELAGQRGRLYELRAQQGELRARLVEWQRQAAALHAQAESVQRELAVMAERARLLTGQRAELEAEVEPLQTQHAAQAERVTQAQAELDKLAQQFDAAQAAIAQAREALARRQAERQTAAGLRRAAEERARRVAGEASERRNRRAQMAERKLELEREQAGHTREQAQLHGELQAHQQTMAEVEADLAALVARAGALRAQAETQAAEAAASQQRQAALDDEWAQARAVETELRARYDAVGAVRAERAGYAAGPRAVLAANVAGVRGALVSLIQVDGEWERAVEAALGPDAQAIVTDDWRTAQAIAARNLGRAMLLPLDAIRALAQRRERGEREALEREWQARVQQAEREYHAQVERAEQARRALRELTARQEQLHKQLAGERRRAQREMLDARSAARRAQVERQQAEQRRRLEAYWRKQQELVVTRRRLWREQLEQRQRELDAARPWWYRALSRVFNHRPPTLNEQVDDLQVDDILRLGREDMLAFVSGGATEPAQVDDILGYEPEAKELAAIRAEIERVVQDPPRRAPEKITPPPRQPWTTAASAVSCDEAVRPVVDALLGQVLLADNLDEAQRMLADLPPGALVATRTGEVVRHSGALTAGAGAGAEAGLLSREREWRELPAQMAIAQQQAAEIQARRDRELKLQADLGRERAALARSLEELNKQIRSRTQERDVLVRAAERLDQQIAFQARLIQQAQADLGGLRDRDQALGAELAELTSQQQAAEAEMRAADDQLAALPLEGLTAQLAQLATSAAVAGQAVQGQQSIARNERTALTQLESQIAARTSRAAQMARQAAELQAALAAQEAQAAQAAGQVAQVEAQLQPAQAELSRLEAEQQIIETQEGAARQKLHEAEGHHNSAVLEAGRREDEINNLRGKIDEDLGLVELDMAEATGPVPLPLKPIVDELPAVSELPEGIETEIQRRKAQLHRIGPISPEVQQEYKETQERHTFLTTQNEDLQKAIESLNQVIAEIDELMRKSFVETFEAIALQFKDTFARLFGGGTARMVLTDPENLTTTGIDIIARPPGKRQQGLALLSGGERTLTAAALLFAILRVKPTPFCFLDEVDAALDEANVGRFRDLLKELSATTQFVIITHNRGTVEAADTIYGITMGGDSASRALSLKLEGETVNAASPAETGLR